MADQNFLSFIFANSADTDEMSQYHLGLHCVCQTTCLSVSRMKRVDNMAYVCHHTQSWGYAIVIELAIRVLVN